MNHDTITSLHNFVESAQYVKSRTGQNGTFSNNLVWFEIRFIQMNLKKKTFLLDISFAKCLLRIFLAYLFWYVFASRDCFIFHVVWLFNLLLSFSIYFVVFKISKGGAHHMFSRKTKSEFSRIFQPIRSFRRKKTRLVLNWLENSWKLRIFFHENIVLWYVWDLFNFF